MDKYFISRGTEKKGPFSIEDLLKMEITEDYLIWKDGFEKWISISEIELLKPHIIKLPPELPITKNENIGFDFKKNLKLYGLVFIGLFILLFIFNGGFSDVDDLRQTYSSYEYRGTDYYGEYKTGLELRQNVAWYSFTRALILTSIFVLIMYIRQSKKVPFLSNIKINKPIFLQSLKLSGIWLLILWIVVFLIMGGYKSEYDLESSYGYGENAIYGGGTVIRKALIMTSFLISLGIALLALFFTYKNKIKNVNKGTNQTP